MIVCYFIIPADIHLYDGVNIIPRISEYAKHQIYHKDDPNQIHHNLIGKSVYWEDNKMFSETPNIMKSIYPIFSTDITYTKHDTVQKNHLWRGFGGEIDSNRYRDVHYVNQFSFRKVKRKKDQPSLSKEEVFPQLFLKWTQSSKNQSTQ